MTNDELIAAQQQAIEKLSAQVLRLKTRLRSKKKFETDLLIHTGHTPLYMSKVDEKDRKVLED